jgi:uncharacterized protein (TIGR03435 family)
MKTGNESERQMRALLITATASLAMSFALPWSASVAGSRVAAQAAAAAAPAQPPVFEVASVKPNKSGEQRVMIRTGEGGRFIATNVPLRVLIRSAFGLQEDSQIADAPSWIASDRFDIAAKAGNDLAPLIPGDPIGPTGLMLQALLAERFRLSVHRETREIPIYVLAFTTGERTLGSRLRKTTVDCAAILAKLFPPGGRGNAGPPPPLAPGQAPPCGSTGGPGRILAQGMTMAQFASIVSGRVNRLVVDKTGLAGTFDLDLEWMPDQFQGSGPLGPLPGAGVPPSSPPDTAGSSIFTALQEQLGLKLESTKGPVEMLVIDHVEQPTPD